MKDVVKGEESAPIVFYTYNVLLSQLCLCPLSVEMLFLCESTVQFEHTP